MKIFKSFILFFLGIFVMTLTCGGSIMYASNSLSMPKTDLAPGETIKINYSGTSQKDWIGVYAKGGTPGAANPSLLWKYTSESGQPDGAMEFDGTLAVGAYDAILLKNDGYTEISKISFNVVEKNIDPVQSKQLFQADPTIFADNNKYYLYGTNEADASNGFKVFMSEDLVHWWSPDGDNDRYALKKGDSFGTSGFWAPQVFLYKGTYYMAYTANEQIAIAKSDSPLGPFKQTTKQALTLNSSNKAIDPYVFFDTDGQMYLYYVELNGGNNICVAKLKDDLSGTVSGTKTDCIKAAAQWENTASSTWPVAEGPTVVKKDGTYYLFYSANDYRNPDYAVGYATSSSPTGPWKKQDGPIISKNNLQINGTGHGDIFTGANNQLFYVLHTHYSNTQPKSRKTAIVELDYSPQTQGEGKFSIDASTFKHLKQYPYETAVDPVKAVIDAISALPAANRLKISDESAVTSARDLYDSLTDAQKALVTNFDVLKAAEQRIVKLKSSGTNPKTGDGSVIPVMLLLAGSFGSVIGIRSKKK